MSKGRQLPHAKGWCVYLGKVRSLLWLAQRKDKMGAWGTSKNNLVCGNKDKSKDQPYAPMSRLWLKLPASLMFALASNCGGREN